MTFVSVTSRKTSAGDSSNLAKSVTGALLTQTSIRPKVLTARRASI